MEASKLSTSAGGVIEIVLSISIIVSIITLYNRSLPVIKHILQINSTEVTSFQSKKKIDIMEEIGETRSQSKFKKYLNTVLNITPICVLLRKCRKYNPKYITPSLSMLLILVGLGIMRFIFMSILYYSSHCNQLLGNISPTCMNTLPVTATVTTTVLGIFYSIASITLAQIFYIKKLITTEDDYKTCSTVQNKSAISNEWKEIIKYFLSFTFSLLILFLESTNIYFGFKFSKYAALASLGYLAIPFVISQIVGFSVSGSVVFWYMKRIDYSMLMKNAHDNSKISSNDNKELLNDAYLEHTIPKAPSINDRNDQPMIGEERVDIEKYNDKGTPITRN